MRKKVLAWALSACAFAAIFFSVQHVLLQQRVIMQDPELCDLAGAYEVYQENAGKIDVCYVGSSPVYAGISPMVVWGESGITGVNFGMSLQTAKTSCLQVRTLLEIQKPRLVVVDLCGLFEARKVSDEKYQQTYRSLVYTAPGLRSKLKMSWDILAENETPGTIYDYSLFLDLHDQWGQLRPVRKPRLPDYFRGGTMSRAPYQALVLPEGYLEGMKTGQADEYAVRYYQKLFELCRGNGVEILAINLPKNDMAWSGEKLENCREFCRQNDVPFIDFNSEEELQKLCLSKEEDFYNQGHLNAGGVCKLSAVLAEKLRTMFGLEDHRGDPAYADWTDDYEKFCADYQDVLKAAE